MTRLHQVADQFDRRHVRKALTYYHAADLGAVQQQFECLPAAAGGGNLQLVRGDCLDEAFPLGFVSGGDQHGAGIAFHEAA